jgi:TIR domain
MSTPGPSPVYDVFLSYRHREADEVFMRQLLSELKAAGYKVAVDKLDFRANQPVLHEMERCAKESRFTVGIITQRYFDSGFTDNEMVIQQTLDMAQRQRRYIPVIAEAGVTMPTWMFGIAGVDYTEVDPLEPPLERLKKALGPPL